MLMWRKDLVIPALKFPAHFSSSPLLAAPHQLPTQQTDTTASNTGSAPESGYRASRFASVAFRRSRRDILAFFRGDVGKHRLPHYSRGIRQSLYRLSLQDNWGQRHKILIGDGQDVPGRTTAWQERLCEGRLFIRPLFDVWL